ncbi:hypothetical protein BYT27DRAFT_7091459 [Phlegmacium glaucopus]|nr:hypothetical protein BYT27DRAFT_7091459 [Phlegmacium glaucopus]
MSSITKVVFPIPPPTTNDLSAHQRAQLLRKAKKLEQIFGATPRLVDNILEPNPIHIVFPRRPSQRRLTKTSRESIDSPSSTSSCESPSSLGRRTPSVSCNSQSISSYHSRASTPVSSIESHESWPGKAKGPVMRLVMKSPTLDTIPASPSPNNMSFPNSPLQSPIDRSSDVSFTQFTLIPNEDSSPRNSIILNSYNITSLNSIRKQKMDRLRRKLGQDVPLDLVFPSDTADSEPSIIIPDLSADVNEACSAHRPPTPRVRKTSGRISTARDSIAESASVHRAKRQAQPPSSSRPGSALSAPRQITTSLSFIIESPDEHGIGCAEEFGQSPKPGNNTTFKSEWTVSTGGAEIKLWSTRRGYEGWHPKSPSKSSQISPRPPLPPSFLSNTESKKRPSSYRKPVPPIPDDCC